MKNLFLVFNIIFSVVIVVLILIQGKGAGLGSAWGGGGEMFATRRGMEKAILWLTVGAIIVFLAISLANLFIN